MRRSIPRHTKPCARRLLFLLVASALLSSSCVEVKADLAVARDGSGKLKLRYAVSKMALSLDALLAENPFLPFPLTRKDWDAAASIAVGTRIDSWSQNEGRDDLITEADISFASMGALAAFIDPKGARASYGLSGSLNSLSFLLWPGLSGKTSLDPDLSKVIKAAFSPYSIDLTIKLPRAAASAGIGSLGKETGTVQFARSLADLAASPLPLVWEIRW